MIGIIRREKLKDKKLLGMNKIQNKRMRTVELRQRRGLR